VKKRPIYSIGHGTRKIEEFIQLLKGLDIHYLIDVRSQPYSKFSPQFNQNDLKFTLEKHGIKYIFMGDSLGGRPSDLSCYDHSGKVDYDKVKNRKFFKDGIERLKTAYEKEIGVVLMCSESKPIECHRSKLIGRTLFDEKINLSHIDENNKLKDQLTVISELNKGKGDIDLFGNPTLNQTSRKSYIQPNE
jgi:uncharacterized protein (DUF488 family)